MNALTTLAYPFTSAKGYFQPGSSFAAPQRTIIRFESLSISHQRESEDHEYRLGQRGTESLRPDAWVISIVECGRLTVTGASGTIVINRGDCLIAHSGWLQAVKCDTAPDGIFEQAFIVVPSSPSFPADGFSPIVLLGDSAPCPEIAIATKLARVLLSNDKKLLVETPRILAEAIAALLTNAIARRLSGTNDDTSEESHYQKILRYIEVHLSNPLLSVSNVSAACGISPRYLSHILKREQTSYSKLVWDQRLARARHLLSAPQEAETPVSEIAYSLGFKSAAHFTRLFKKRFGKTPTQSRMPPAGQPDAARLKQH